MSGFVIPLVGSSFGLTIGAAYQGGYFAGQISTAGNGIADYNLVVAPLASGQTDTIRRKIIDTATSGTSSVIDGPTNSSNMNNSDHPAAEFCEGLTIGGYTDWYMPAKNELEVCYYNLKPFTDANSTSSGTNTNAVPSRGSNYTSGTPAQTSASDFTVSGSQPFAYNRNYWSSTEETFETAWYQFFGTGSQQAGLKSSYLTVRAIRRVPVPT